MRKASLEEEERGPKMTLSPVSSRDSSYSEVSELKTGRCQEATAWSLAGNPSAVRTHWKFQVKDNMVGFVGWKADCLRSALPSGPIAPLSLLSDSHSGLDPSLIKLRFFSVQHLSPIFQQLSMRHGEEP